MPGRRYFIGLFLLCLAALAGCGLDDREQVECRCTEDTDLNLFPHCLGRAASDPRPDADSPLATRIPDCPSGSPLFLRERTRPTDVLFNVKTTFENFSSNQYMEQLTEDFAFVPDQEDIDLHPEVYQAPPDYDPDRDTLWNREQERRFAVELLDPKRFQKIDFIRWYKSTIDEVRPSEDGLRETYIFPYDLDFIEQPRDGVSNRFGVKGVMEVDLVTPTQENPVWSIQRWWDQRDRASAKRSWGEVRAEFSR